MKVRLGFVSNSSSSSFILGYKDDQYVDLVKKLFLFRDIDSYFSAREFNAKEKQEFFKNLGFPKAIVLEVPYGSDDLFSTYSIKHDENFTFISSEDI